MLQEQTMRTQVPSRGSGVNQETRRNGKDCMKLTTGEQTDLQSIRDCFNHCMKDKWLTAKCPCDSKSATVRNKRGQISHYKPGLGVPMNCESLLRKQARGSKLKHHWVRQPDANWPSQQHMGKVSNVALHHVNQKASVKVICPPHPHPTPPLAKLSTPQTDNTLHIVQSPFSARLQL